MFAGRMFLKKKQQIHTVMYYGPNHLPHSTDLGHCPVLFPFPFKVTPYSCLLFGRAPETTTHFPLISEVLAAGWGCACGGVWRGSGGVKVGKEDAHNLPQQSKSPQQPKVPGAKTAKTAEENGEQRRKQD